MDDADAHRVTSFSHEGLTFDVVDTGPIDGKIIVLLHGWPQMAKCWARVAAALNADGYRTVAPNQRGYSPGARPHRVAAYRMPHLVGDVVALIERLGGGPVHVVGHDWGAAVAWALAAQHPAAVRTLTTVSVPHSGAFMRSMLSSDQLFRSYYMGLFQLPKLPELFVTRGRKLFEKMLARTGMTRDEVDAVYTDIVDAGALTTSLNWYRAMALTPPGYLSRKVSVPVLHIWGERDAALSRRGAELARHFVSGPYRLEVLPHATHWIPEHDADRLAALIRESIAMRPDAAPGDLAAAPAN
ncbi:alpha/beta fold hydrolase [Burkholderia oklahomensis]|uniref:alpha/beta fold hydrolase n=1 Tax=Burkholderia oklahomensis TaxID=342113 RepID=UPI002651BDE2|nr:alpha/beta fold hydrolase [Burkholderia oklahomensis]MDN7671210.1 alpha/beta fold hydrolase [Burkholderia oklahomensis]